MAYIAPAGTPVRLRDIAHGLTGLIASRQASDALSASLRKISRLACAWPVSSGRAAMTITLTAMRQTCADSSRDEVIIPAYTCYSVPAAIERAGLKPRLCDVDPSTLGMDLTALERCDFSRTLAVISASLYGLPDDLMSIEEVCRRRGVFMLDDAAQALGASLAGRPVGSFGDAGLYSFDKGKVISTIQGGAIVAHHGALMAGLTVGVDSLPRCAMTEVIANIVRLVAYSVMLRPALYGLAQRLPFTGLGQTVYETQYTVAQLSAWQTGVAELLIDRLDEMNDARRRRASEFAEEMEGLSGFEPVRPLKQANPVFVRFPLRVTASGVRDKIIARLNQAGIGATASYPLSLADVPEVVARIPNNDRSMPGAREVARTIMTLPTHAYCPPTLARRVHEILATCIG